jgi:uncharacterized protein
MKVLHAIAFILVVVGALNWGLVGAADVNVVNMLLGTLPVVEKVVYVLVGLSGILLVVTHRKDCKHCESAPVAAPMAM